MTPWTVGAWQAPTVHGISQARILEWLPFPSPGDLPNPGIEDESPALQADSLPFELPEKTYVYSNKLQIVTKKS